MFDGCKRRAETGGLRAAKQPGRRICIRESDGGKRIGVCQQSISRKGLRGHVAHASDPYPGPARAGDGGAILGQKLRGDVIRRPRASLCSSRSGRRPWSRRRVGGSAARRERAIHPGPDCISNQPSIVQERASFDWATQRRGSVLRRASLVAGQGKYALPARSVRPLQFSWAAPRRVCESIIFAR